MPVLEGFDSRSLKAVVSTEKDVFKNIKPSEKKKRKRVETFRGKKNSIVLCVS